MSKLIRGSLLAALWICVSALLAGVSAAQEYPRPWNADFKAWPQDKRIAYINGVLDGARLLGYKWVCSQGVSVDQIAGTTAMRGEDWPKLPIVLALLSATVDLGCDPEKIPRPAIPKRVPPK